MKTIIENINIKAVNSWLPENKVEVGSFSSLYGEAEIKSIVKTTGIEQIRIADSNMTSSDMCFNAAEHLLEHRLDFACHVHILTRQIRII